MANIRKTFNFRNGVQVDEDNFIVDSLGKVGIGTTVPTQMIDCRGDVKDGKVTWEEGVPQVCDVMNHLHEAFNKSDKPMEILFVDVKHDTEVVINR